VFNLVAEVLVEGVNAVTDDEYKYTCDNVFAQVLMYADSFSLLSNHSQLLAQVLICEKLVNGEGISNLTTKMPRHV